MKETNPAISVVMPVYNGGLYLKEAIDSILNQTFTDFEFIIINDGSTDNSENVILSFNDNRIRYFYKENTGISDTLRYGIDKSKGFYIARMDADDISLPKRLQLQFDYLKRNKNCILVGSAVYYIDERGSFIGRSLPYSSDFAIKFNLKFGSVIVHPSVMFTKSAYEKSHGYNIFIKGMFEDYILWLDMSEYGKYHNLSIPLLSYRISNQSWYFKINQIELRSTMSKIYNLIENNKYHEIKTVYDSSINSILSKNVNLLGDITKFKSKYVTYKSKFSYLENILFFILSGLKNIYSFQNYVLYKIKLLIK